MATLDTSALTTLEEAKDSLGVDDPDEDDRVIKLINRASARIAAFLGGAVHYEQGIIESAIGQGTPELLLRRRPIVVITSISLDGSVVAAGNYEVQDPESGAVFNRGGWDWTTFRNPGVARDPAIGNEERRYDVVYDAGWWTPAMGPTVPVGVTSLPREIEAACLALVDTMYAQRGRDRDVASESLMAYSVSYRAPSSSQGNAGLPDEVASMLMRHKFLEQTS